MKKINKCEIVEIVADKAHLSKKDARSAVDEVFNLISQSLIDNAEVVITNFGTFIPKSRKSRIGTNPKTHEIMKLPAATSIVFKPAKELKDKINK